MISDKLRARGSGRGRGGWGSYKNLGDHQEASHMSPTPQWHGVLYGQTQVNGRKSNHVERRWSHGQNVKLTRIDLQWIYDAGSTIQLTKCLPRKALRSYLGDLRIRESISLHQVCPVGPKCCRLLSELFLLRVQHFVYNGGCSKAR